MTCIVSLYTQHSEYFLKLFAVFLPNCKYSAGRKSVYVSTLSLQYTHSVFMSVTFTFSSCDFYSKLSEASTCVVHFAVMLLLCYCQ